MEHRISAGALVINDRKLLLVHCVKSGVYDFWVAPGGGVKGTESLHEAAIREVKEESGLEIAVDDLFYIEEMHQPEMRICKFWILGNIVNGKIDIDTESAVSENIVEAKFMLPDEIPHEKVFPSMVLDEFWDDLKDRKSLPRQYDLRKMAFY